MGPGVGVDVAVGDGPGGVGVLVIVGVAVGVAVAPGKTARAPPCAPASGISAALIRVRIISSRLTGVIPTAVACNRTVAMIPDPLGPGGDDPSVTQTSCTRSVPRVGRHTTVRPVLPRKGPTLTSTGVNSVPLKTMSN